MNHLIDGQKVKRWDDGVNPSSDEFKQHINMCCHPSVFVLDFKRVNVKDDNRRIAAIKWGDYEGTNGVVVEGCWVFDQSKVTSGLKIATELRIQAKVLAITEFELKKSYQQCPEGARVYRKFLTFSSPDEFNNGNELFNNMDDDDDDDDKMCIGEVAIKLYNKHLFNGATHVKDGDTLSLSVNEDSADLRTMVVAVNKKSCTVGTVAAPISEDLKNLMKGDGSIIEWSGVLTGTASQRFQCTISLWVSKSTEEDIVESIVTSLQVMSRYTETTLHQVPLHYNLCQSAIDAATSGARMSCSIKMNTFDASQFGTFQAGLAFHGVRDAWDTNADLLDQWFGLFPHMLEEWDGGYIRHLKRNASLAPLFEIFTDQFWRWLKLAKNLVEQKRFAKNPAAYKSRIERLQGWGLWRENVQVDWSIQETSTIGCVAVPLAVLSPVDDTQLWAVLGSQSTTGALLCCARDKIDNAINGSDSDENGGIVTWSGRIGRSNQVSGERSFRVRKARAGEMEGIYTQYAQKLPLGGSRFIPLSHWTGKGNPTVAQVEAIRTQMGEEINDYLFHGN